MSLFSRIRKAVSSVVSAVVDVFRPSKPPETPPTPPPVATVIDETAAENERRREELEAARKRIADELGPIPDDEDEEVISSAKWGELTSMVADLGFDASALDHWKQRADVYELVQAIMGLAIADDVHGRGENYGFVDPVTTGMLDEMRLELLELAASLASLDSHCFIVSTIEMDGYNHGGEGTRATLTHAADGSLRRFIRWALWRLVEYRAFWLDLSTFAGPPRPKKGGRPPRPPKPKPKGRKPKYRKAHTRDSAKKEQNRLAAQRYRARKKQAAAEAARIAKRNKPRKDKPK
jgi:hypothetical protein